MPSSVDSSLCFSKSVYAACILFASYTESPTHLLSLSLYDLRSHCLLAEDWLSHVLKQCLFSILIFSSSLFNTKVYFISLGHSSVSLRLSMLSSPHFSETSFTWTWRGKHFKVSTEHSPFFQDLIRNDAMKWIEMCSCDTFWVEHHIFLIQPLKCVWIWSLTSQLLCWHVDVLPFLCAKDWWKHFVFI